MNFNELLGDKRNLILKGWYESVLSSYPEETSNVIRNQKDRFENPVGEVLAAGIEQIYDRLTVAAPSQTEPPAFLLDLMRVRSLQHVTASGAVSFIFLLKNVVRDVLQESLQGASVEFLRDLLLFESRVDRLALDAFDAYSRVRENFLTLRTREVRNNTYRLLQQAGVAKELNDPDADVTRMPAN